MTVEIDFNNNKTALTAEPFEGSSLETLKLTARLLDSSNKEIPLDDLKYEHVKFQWDWFAYNQNLVGGYTSSEQKGYYTLEYLNELKTELDTYFIDNPDGVNITDKNILT